MNPPGLNLLDLLDALRDLPPEQRERRLEALPAAARDQLRQWLKAGQGAGDPFDPAPNALAGADPQVLSQLAEMCNALSKERERHEDLTRGIESTLLPPDASVSTARPIHRPGAPAETRLTFQAGDVLLKRYRIICQLGRGGMGEVFRAIDQHTGEQVALKFLTPDHMSNPQALDLLKSEVRLAHLVRSPYVCAVHALHLDIDAPPGGKALPPFLVMQFVEGEDLQTLLKRVETISGEKVIRIAHELSKGLAAIHAAGILHRDLKPSNVMLDLNGTVQVLDFGIAAVKDGTGSDSAVVAGTPAYMAPEARTQPATAACDIYALGLLMFELATGQMASRLIRQGAAPGQLIEQFGEQIPRGLTAPLTRCLQHNPADRFKDMDELLGALPPAPAPRRRTGEGISTIARSENVAPARPWAIAITLAFVIVAAIAVFLVPSPIGLAAASSQLRDPAELRVVAHSIARLFHAQDDHYVVHGLTAALANTPADVVDGGMERRTLHFWYRSGKTPFEPASALHGVSETDPAPVRGMTTVSLDANGALLEAYRQPESDAAPSSTHGGKFPAALADDLGKRTQSIGAIQLPFVSIDRADCPAGWSPPLSLPGRAEFWTESSHGGADKARPPLLVATLGDEPFYIGRPMAPASADSALRERPVPAAFAWLDGRMRAPMQWLRRNTGQDMAFWWMYVLPILGLALAARNVRLRRCDTRHAVRLALWVFVFSLLGWIMMTRPALSGKLMGERWNIGIGTSLLLAAQAWIAYAAADPYARLTWKRCLIGYARLTTGGPAALVRDAIVGRSLLAGMAFGFALALLLKMLDHWTLTATVISAREQISASLLDNPMGVLGLVCRAAASAITFSLLQLVTLVLMHWLTRRQSIAIALFCVITPLLWILYRNDFAFPGYLIYPAIGILTAVVLIHEGIVAAAVALFVSTLATIVPITFDPAAINFGMSIVVVVVLAGFAIAGLIAVMPKSTAIRLWSDPIHVGGADGM